MEKAATAGRKAGHRWEISLLSAAGLAIAALTSPATAADANALGGDVLLAEARI